MKPYMTGAGKAPEERKLSFCIGAKLCSGKASNKEEAKQICLTQPPKEPRARTKRGRIDSDALAQCVIKGLTPTHRGGTPACVLDQPGEINKEYLSALLSECLGQKKGSEVA